MNSVVLVDVIEARGGTSANKPSCVARDTPQQSTPTERSLGYTVHRYAYTGSHYTVWNENMPSKLVHTVLFATKNCT